MEAEIHAFAGGYFIKRPRGFPGMASACLEWRGSRCSSDAILCHCVMVDGDADADGGDDGAYDVVT